MVNRARATTLIVFRAFFGLAFLALLGTLSLYLFGREGRPEPVRPVDDAEIADSEDYPVKSEGFRFTLAKGERNVFEIEGEEQKSDRAGVTVLTNVRVTVERSDGVYSVEAREAFYEPETQAALLIGEVIVHGPRGLQLEAPRLELTEGGDELIAREGATFSSAERITGRADFLRVGSGMEEFTLTGGVLLESGPAQLPPFELQAEKMVLHRGHGYGLASGGVQILSEGSELFGSEVELTLDTETGEITFLKLEYNVEGILYSNWKEDPTSSLDLKGDSLSIFFDAVDGRPTGLSLVGNPKRQAKLRQTRPDGSSLSVQMVTLKGTFTEGVLSRAEVGGGVEILSLPEGRDGLALQAKARTGDVRFAEDGSLAGFTLDGDVTVWDRQILAEGDRAYFDLSKGEIELFGSPVKVSHERGTLEAKRLRYLQSLGIIHGRGEVSAVLRQSSAAAGLSLGGDSGPIRVEAEETFWLTNPNSVMFQGHVRAWQGTSTLLAEQLRSEGEGKMLASGGVRTFITPSSSGRRARKEPKDEGAFSLPRGQIEIFGEDMTYQRDVREVVYRGSVTVVQENSSLSCLTLTIYLDADNQARDLTCEGEVTIFDRQRGFTLDGGRALYDLDTQVVEVFGEPITMTDSEGSKVGGACRMTYSFADESLVLSSCEASPPTSEAEDA